MLELIFLFPHSDLPGFKSDRLWPVSWGSNRKARVCMCRISQAALIHGPPRSARPYIIGCFPPSLPSLSTQASYPANSSRSSEGNDTPTPQDLWEIHSPFASLFTEYTDSPTRELLPSLVVDWAGGRGPSTGCHRAPAAHRLWQVPIESQTQVASSQSSSLTFC